MSLLDYERRFSTLKLNTRGGGEKSPHKVALLLSVIALIDSKVIVENRIMFDRILKETFTKQFNSLANDQDRDNPHLPFFHLRSSGFWQHYIKPGKSDDYGVLTTVSSSGGINDNIAYAYFDDELFELLLNGVARELLKSALHKTLTDQDRTELLDVGKGWDWLECEAVVQDYFSMLHKELCGEKYNKSEHRRSLLLKLNNRSEGSVEFKHQNISAVLIAIGLPYIQGYKPAFNYQHQLKDVVFAHMACHALDLEKIVKSAEAEATVKLELVDWNLVLDSELPERISSIQDTKRQYLARKTNFAEREKNNRKLGECGEAFVIEFERYRLNMAGRSDLAKEVKWRSKEQGDGLGYDVRSFNPEVDDELFIEVKTTNSGKYQPFFISDNEVAFSRERARNYSLYRVYDFKQQAKIYQLQGAIDQYVHLVPKTYKASFS